MEDILITKPFRMLLKMHDADYNQHAICVSLEIVLPDSKNGATFTSNAIWYNCKEWDQFSKSLLSGNQSSHLFDRGEQVKISFKVSEKESPKVELTCIDSRTGKEIEELNFSTDLSEETQAHWQEEFEGFPNWW